MRDAAGPESGFAREVIDRAELATAPSERLDAILRAAIPGFALFRRADSRLANPTAQGVSLRGIGPSGAGRSLVLLDGLPQNDPFGGWVYWSRLPAGAIESAEVTAGAGAGLWGNAALGGVIELFRRVPRSNGARLEAGVGTADTFSGAAEGEWFRSLADGRALSLSGRLDGFRSDGYPLLRADQRGPVDVPARSEAVSGSVGMRLGLAHDTTLSLQLAGFREERGNGTPYTTNATRALDASAALDLPLGPGRLRLQLYGQWRGFRSTFSAVNDARTAETPSLDQFAVPAQALGASAVYRLAVSASAQATAGLDLREVSGETRERFRFVNGAFTRLREAGGRQRFGGVFGEFSWRPDERTTLTAAARVDLVSSDQGHRRERELASGAAVTDATFPAERYAVATGRLGLRREFGPAVWRVAVYSGFRQPTLNELYRPFRVRNDVTEANAALRPERLYGAETGFDLRLHARLRTSVTAFYNELHRPIVNVTVAEGPGTFPLFGFLPAGGVGRQRQNLGRAEIVGVQSALDWTPADSWTFGARHLYTHGLIRRAPSPALLDRRFAQAPAHTATAFLRWQPRPRWFAQLQATHTGAQFEDDLNQRRLPAATTVDASLGAPLGPHWSLRAAVENAFQARVEAGRSPEGLVTLATPRTATLTLRAEW
ncbi:MAG: TonB-dependent receptor [Verrucomicrobia bacterium]|nr:TonB-dependent receptor [Verrucomicrobiota bacterium]